MVVPLGALVEVVNEDGKLFVEIILALETELTLPVFSLPPPEPPVPPVTTPTLFPPYPPPFDLKIGVEPNNISLSAPLAPGPLKHPVLSDIPPLPTFTEYVPAGKFTF